MDHDQAFWLPLHRQPRLLEIATRHQGRPRHYYTTEDGQQLLDARTPAQDFGSGPLPSGHRLGGCRSRLPRSTTAWVSRSPMTAPLPPPARLRSWRRRGWIGVFFTNPGRSRPTPH